MCLDWIRDCRSMLLLRYVSGTSCLLQVAQIPTSFPRSPEFAMHSLNIWKQGASQWTTKTKLALQSSGRYLWWQLPSSQLIASSQRKNTFSDGTFSFVVGFHKWSLGLWRVPWWGQGLFHPWRHRPLSGSKRHPQWIPALRQDTEGLSRWVLNTLVRARALDKACIVYMYGDLQSL